MARIKITVTARIRIRIKITVRTRIKIRTNRKQGTDRQRSGKCRSFLFVKEERAFLTLLDVKVRQDGIPLYRLKLMQAASPPYRLIEAESQISYNVCGENNATSCYSRYWS